VAKLFHRRQESPFLTGLTWVRLDLVTHLTRLSSNNHACPKDFITTDQEVFTDIRDRYIDNLSDLALLGAYSPHPIIPFLEVAYSFYDAFSCCLITPSSLMISVERTLHV
jgi:hypothetical protein